jgi:hypothetical protein
MVATAAAGCLNQAESRSALTPGAPEIEDHASPKKADAGHDPLCHACGIGADRIEWRLGHPLALIDRHEHKEDTRAQLVGSQSASRGWLWSPA